MELFVRCYVYAVIFDLQCNEIIKICKLIETKNRTIEA